jgi:serine/threonine-protein kinase
MSSGPPPGTEPGASGAPAPLSDWIQSHDETIGTPGSASAQPPAAGAGELRLTPGTMLAERYRIVAPLGRGGMGEIYRAEDTKLGQAVALKFLRGALASDPDLLQRLLAEVRIGRDVSHPNVCRIYDVVEYEGHHFIAMEYVDGEDLASLLSRIGRLPPDKALELARDLCAGLAAVHDKGVVHRDLKPANVMIDGRGRARITDFGLAVPKDAAQREALAGTPAYMSPEQLAGSEATPRSDLYALGLVLYEMFTGRRFFDALTFGELQAQHREPKALKLSSGLRLELPVERAVLQCLEEDPAARPTSVRALAASLPGGDPLEAAVAAGETPSPELVAAAGRAGDLSVAWAWAGLLTVVAGLAAAAGLAERTTLLGLAPPPKPAAVLVERSKAVLARLGHAGVAADTAARFDLDTAFTARWGEDGVPARWQDVRGAGPGPWRFLYRTSPRKLVAANRDAVVGGDDPPLDVSGMTRLWLHPDGRLVGFAAVPPQLDEAPPPWPVPDFRPLLEEAGLDPGALREVPPRWAAPVDSDHKAAWEVLLPGLESPVRVEAASYHGRPVWLEVQSPWLKPDRMQRTIDSEARVPVSDASVALLALAMPIGGLLLARRNIRLGRGDRAGAFRVALFVFTVYSLARLVQADHVTRFGQELWVLVKVVAYPSFWALQVWVLYMALEPYARRRWPHVLIGWKRLLTGSLSDPLVGRDLLLGTVAGVALTVAYFLFLAAPGWLGVPQPAPGSNISGLTITSLRHVGFRLLVNQYSALLFGLVFLFVLVLLRVLLRSDILAALVFCLVVAGPARYEASPYALASGAVRAVVLYALLMRGGLLRLVAALFVLFSLIEASLTLDPSRWYAAHALPVVLVVVALSAYGFRTALAGKTAFGGLIED